MNRHKFVRMMTVILVCGCCFAVRPAEASFHFMQIEQVIGGVNGDTTAQAIQLRMRAFGQNLVQSSKLVARDATGSNDVLLIDMATFVANGAAGSRVLITTPNFANYTDVPLVSDFTMSPIPSSYLAAGQITFEGDTFGKYWVLNFGGASYTGSTTGLSTNDEGFLGDFGPPFGGPLPSTSTSALQFQGIASALSTTNAADYAVTAGAATFINNAGTQFTLLSPPEDSANFDEDSDIDGADYLIWQRGFGSAGGLNQGDANNSGGVDGDDLLVWEAQYGQSPVVLSAVTSVPEPGSILLLLCGVLVLPGVRSRKPRDCNP